MAKYVQPSGSFEGEYCDDLNNDIRLICLYYDSHPKIVRLALQILGPKLLLAMGCVKLGEKICVHLPSVGEQTA